MRVLLAAGAVAALLVAAISCDVFDHNSYRLYQYEPTPYDDDQSPAEPDDDTNPPVDDDVSPSGEVAAAAAVCGDWPSPSRRETTVLAAARIDLPIRDI